MPDEILVKIDGEVERPTEWTFNDLEAFSDSDRIIDVSQFDSKRRGDAIKLSSLLAAVQVKPTARFIGLHGSLDNFHASIPLGPLRDRGMLIYRLDGRPLDTKSGGPTRFFIADHAACHMEEIDECANVKFVDHIELTVERGFDNRPTDDEEHQKLHDQQPS